MDLGQLKNNNIKMMALLYLRLEPQLKTVLKIKRLTSLILINDLIQETPYKSQTVNNFTSAGIKNLQFQQGFTSHQQLRPTETRPLFKV